MAQPLFPNPEVTMQWTSIRPEGDVRMPGH